MYEAAIQFTLESGPEVSDQLLCDDFFHYWTGASRDQVESTWRSRLRGLQTTQFPPLPHTSFRTRVDSTTEYTFVNTHLSPRADVTPVLWTAWTLLTAAWTGSDDIVFGAILSTSDTSSTRKSLAQSTSTSVVPVRFVIDHNLRVTQALNNAVAISDEAKWFRRIGRHLIHLLGDDGERACSFQSVLQVQQDAQDVMDDAEFDESWIPCEEVALQLRCHIRSDGSTALLCRFDSSVIQPTKVQRMLRQFGHIVGQLQNAEPDAMVRDIRSTSEEDLVDIWGWNATVPEGVEACVHDLFTSVAVSQPDATAVCAWDGDLTYRELDTLSSTVASRLVVLGVGPGSIIPLCFEKSKWMLVGMLGIMKAGAASVTMDTTYPEAQLQSIVRQAHTHDSKQHLLILSSRRNQNLSRRLLQQGSSPSGQVLVVETEVQRRQDTPALPEHPPIKVRPQDLLYIVFTSGSTGTPKGVMISHYNFSSVIHHQHERLGLEPSSRVYDFVSYAFDVAWFNALPPLIVGACLCIPSEDERKDSLLSSIRDSEANYIFMTPTAAQLIEPRDVPCLRRVVFAGERLQRSDVRRWDGGPVKVGNLYGVAECTVSNILAAEIPTKESGEPSMGTGCGSVSWIVRLDAASLASVGEVGELWLEGPLVGQGYLGDAEKTAASFIRNPPWLLAGVPSRGIRGRSGRLYRTGDLALYNPDGTLQFAGRKDSQVKIRGQRVELGDVEAHVKALLSSKPDAQVVAEVITPRDAHNPVLAAFISPSGAADISPEGLRILVAELTGGLNDKLLARVPPHKIPGTYIPIAAIPTTGTGKTDRKKLQEIGRDLDLLQPVEITNKNRPRTELEKILAQSWADVLDIPLDRISTRTPFTRLGGDSITAMQLISRLRIQQVQLAVGDILRHQTIETIVPRCRLLAQTSTTKINEVSQEATDEAWGPSPIQRLFFSSHPEGLNHYNQSFLLELRDSFTETEVRKTATLLVHRHHMLRARFKHGPGCWEQYIIQSSPDAFLFATHTFSSHDEMHRVARDRQGSLDIVNGPVFAVDYFNIITQDQTFILLTAHHLVIDLVSWRILWREMEDTLKGAAPLPPLSGTSFHQWAAIQEKLGCESDLSDLLPFPLTHQIESWDVSPSENTLAAVEEYSIRLDAPTTSLLLGSANQGLRTEPLDIMVGVLIHSLHETFPDRPAPAIFLEGHGREPLNDTAIDLSGTVGWFTSICPVQISLQGGNSNTQVEAIKLVKDTRRAVPGKGLPYFAAINYGRDSGSSHERPNAEFLFNYGGVFQQLEGHKSIFRRTSIELPTASQATRRMALVEINGTIVEGALCLSVSIHKHMRHLRALEQWAHSLPGVFSSATRYLDTMVPMPTLSDFPLLNASYDELGSIMAQLQRKGLDLGDVQDLLPCTPLQEGMLLAVARGLSTYHISLVWECLTTQGVPVDAARLESAWRTATAHHSIFSSVMVESAELQTFLQVQLARSPTTQTHRRVAHSGDGRLESAADTLTRMPAPQFSSMQPPFCVTICEGPGDDEQTATVCCRLDISHAIVDATSFPILLDDVAKAYDRVTAEQTPPSFHTIVKEIMGVPLESKLEYWRHFLDGAEPCRIPLLARAQGTDVGEEPHKRVTINSSVTNPISAFCQDSNITRSTFLQVAWAMMLSQLTHKQDVCFAYLASGRDVNVEDVDGVVGPLINTLISRIDVGASAAGSVLSETGRHLVNHFDFQHVPLARLQSDLRLRGERLFNTSMTVRKAMRFAHDGKTSGLRLKAVSIRETAEVRATFSTRESMYKPHLRAPLY